MDRNKRNFIEEFPDKDLEAKAMLVAAFRGVLSVGIDGYPFDPATVDRMLVVDEIRDARRRELLADRAKRPGFFAGIRKAVGL